MLRLPGNLLSELVCLRMECAVLHVLQRAKLACVRIESVLQRAKLDFVRTETDGVHVLRHPGNLLATPEGDLAYLDFGASFLKLKQF